MTRAQKIQFLEGLKAGTRSINEILPHLVEFFRENDGFYIDIKSGKKIPAEKFASRELPLHGTHHIVIFKSFGNK